jgi:hypothetical protein
MIVGGRATMRGTRFEEHAWLERTVFHGPRRSTEPHSEATPGLASALRCLDVVCWHGFSRARLVRRRFLRRSGRLRARCVPALRRFPRRRGAPGVGLGGTTFLGPARVSRRGEHWNITAPRLVGRCRSGQSVGGAPVVGGAPRARGEAGRSRIARSPPGVALPTGIHVVGREYFAESRVKVLRSLHSRSYLVFVVRKQTLELSQMSWSSSKQSHLVCGEATMPCRRLATLPVVPESHPVAS